MATGPLDATPDDVAALLRARTKDSAGVEVGVFSDQTRPTLGQVQQQIDLARSFIVTRLGVVPDTCAAGLETLVALLAAMLVELGYWPEQVASEQSPYLHYQALYQEGLTALAECVAGNQPGAGQDPASWRVYDVSVAGPPDPFPFDWWQRDLEQAP